MGSRWRRIMSYKTRPAGLEPATTRLEGVCSIQLSYGRMNQGVTPRCYLYNNKSHCTLSSTLLSIFWLILAPFF